MAIKLSFWLLKVGAILVVIVC